MKVQGKAHIYGAVLKNAPQLTLEQAFAALREEMASGASCDILAAHLEILEDPMLEESISSGIARGLQPQEAVRAAAGSICTMFDGMDDEYLRSRADDVRDVCRRLEMKISGEAPRTDIPEGCILVAEELFPSDMAVIASAAVRGISCRRGSKTSHVVIMAHQRGIPIETGVDNSYIKEGETVCVDDPCVGSDIALKVRLAGRALYANAGSVEDIRSAIGAGADGIGLFRTEFLFLNSPCAPSFDFQREIYRQALEYCKGKVLTIRTMDIGGDKPLPWLGLPPESNPFLGLRGIRLSLRYPEMLTTQLEAIARAASQVPECRLRIMFPMVCCASEVARAKALLGGKAAGLTFGAMIETPSAALDIEALSAECDFFSIGSNDLTQYVMAADRGNPAVAEYYDPLCPVMRGLIGEIVTRAHRCGKTVGICGELASDPAATDFLLGTGLDSLSINKFADETKRSVRSGKN